MSMQDFASALGGSGGPPGAGGPPPDLGAGGPPPGADPNADPNAAPPDDQQGGGDQYSNSLEALDGAEEALKAFIDLDPDHGDKAIAAQCLQNVLKLKASNQDSAASGDMKSLARALQGGPGAVGGPGGAATLGGAGGY